MRMDLAEQSHTPLDRDVGDIVEERRIDIDKVPALLDEVSPQPDQVGDFGGIGIVFAEPEDDPLATFKAVYGHFGERIFNRGCRYAPEPRRREILSVHLKRP